MYCKVSIFEYLLLYLLIVRFVESTLENLLHRGIFLALSYLKDYVKYHAWKFYSKKMFWMHFQGIKHGEILNRFKYFKHSYPWNYEEAATNTCMKAHVCVFFML